MPFIAQGKSNVKYLGIVAVCTALAVAGIFLYRQYSDKKAESIYQSIANNQTNNQSTQEYPIESYQEGKTYSLAKDSSDGKVYLYERKKEKKIWIDYLPIDIKKISNFYYDKESDSLFVVNVINYSSKSQNYKDEIIYYYQNNGSLGKKTLYTGRDVPSYILNFYPTVKRLVINSGNSDERGVSKGEEIWFIDTDKNIGKQIIQNCPASYIDASKEGNPRFLGLFSGYLVFVEYDLKNYQISRLFSVDPKNLAIKEFKLPEKLSIPTPESLINSCEQMYRNDPA